MHNMYITIPHAICSFTHACSLYVCMYVYVYIYVCDPALPVPHHQPPKGMGFTGSGVEMIPTPRVGGWGELCI